MKPIITKIIIFVSLLMFTNSKSYAVGGVGDIVTDPLHTAVSTINGYKQDIVAWAAKIKNEYNWAIKLYNDTQLLYNDTVKIYNQYEQLERMATMLQSLDTSSLSTIKQGLTNTYYLGQNTYYALDSMLVSSEQVASNFDKTYLTLDKMAALDKKGWNTIVTMSGKDLRDSNANARIKLAATLEQSKALQEQIKALNDQNSSVAGIKQAAQLGNAIALKQMQIIQSENEAIGLMLKQQADNQNNIIMLQQAALLEARQTFKYTPVPVSSGGPGLYHIK